MWLLMLVLMLVLILMLVWDWRRSHLHGRQRAWLPERVVSLDRRGLDMLHLLLLHGLHLVDLINIALLLMRRILAVWRRRSMHVVRCKCSKVALDSFLGATLARLLFLAL